MGNACSGCYEYRDKLFELVISYLDVSLSDWALVDRNLQIYLKECNVAWDAPDYFGIRIAMFPDQENIISSLIRGKKTNYKGRIRKNYIKPDTNVLLGFKKWNDIE